MAHAIQRVTFSKNAMGLAWVEVDTKSWIIVAACSNASSLVNRACRLVDRGKKLEYRTGSTYTTINAAIEKIA